VWVSRGCWNQGWGVGRGPTFETSGGEMRSDVEFGRRRAIRVAPSGPQSSLCVLLSSGTSGTVRLEEPSCRTRVRDRARHCFRLFDRSTGSSSGSISGSVADAGEGSSGPSSTPHSELMAFEGSLDDSSRRLRRSRRSIGSLSGSGGSASDRWGAGGNLPGRSLDCQPSARLLVEEVTPGAGRA
jgi:hypothetical protein